MNPSVGAQLSAGAGGVCRGLVHGPTLWELITLVGKQMPHRDSDRFRGTVPWQEGSGNSGLLPQVNT